MAMPTLRAIVAALFLWAVIGIECGQTMSTDDKHSFSDSLREDTMRIEEAVEIEETAMAAAHVPSLTPSGRLKYDTLLVKGFPKSGTQWIDQLAGATGELVCSTLGISVEDCSVSRIERHNKHDHTAGFIHHSVETVEFKNRLRKDCSDAVQNSPRVGFINVYRDPRDVVVSSYYWVHPRRTPIDKYTRGIFRSQVIAASIMHERYMKTGDSIILRYERMHRHGESQLRALLRFIGFDDSRVSTSQLTDVINANSISVATAAERNNTSARLAKKNDAHWQLSTVHARKGAVGDYKTLYLPDTLAWMEEVMRELLPRDLQECYMTEGRDPSDDCAMAYDERAFTDLCLTLA